MARWLLVLQLGNYTKAWKLRLILQSKISPCTSITKEAEVREEAEVCDSFFPTVLLWNNIHYKETWYLVWQVYLPDTAVRSRIAGLGFLSLTTRRKKKKRLLQCISGGC